MSASLPTETAELVAARISSSIHVEADGCWLWTKSCNHRGYGQMTVAGRNMGAHRASYMAFIGPIPDGLQLDHLCRVRRCVNPGHLEPVTPKENIQRSPRAMRTHCRLGHEYTPENTRMRSGARKCLDCHRIHQARYLTRQGRPA